LPSESGSSEGSGALHLLHLAADFVGLELGDAKAFLSLPKIDFLRGRAPSAPAAFTSGEVGAVPYSELPNCGEVESYDDPPATAVLSEVCGPPVPAADAAREWEPNLPMEPKMEERFEALPLAGFEEGTRRLGVAGVSAALGKGATSG